MRRARRRIEPLSPAEQRRAWEALSLPSPLSRRVSVRTQLVGDVPATIVTPLSRPEPDATVVYLHGGGYVFGSFVTHRELVVRLCLGTGARVVVPDYRLAPEHPFPAAIDDAMAVLRELSATMPTSRLIVAGDSAGGGLTAALLLRARDEGLPLPAAAAMLSPWVDIGSRAATEERVRTDWLDPEWGGRHADLYLAGADAAHPWASPIFGALGGLCPLFVQIGEAEVLFDQGATFARRARDAGVEVELDLHPGMVHSWQLFVGAHPPSQVAIDRFASFVRRRLAASRSSLPSR